jgi:hypothetical protein
VEAIKRMFKVTIKDTKRTSGVEVRLPVPRTEEQVERLKIAYENVIAHAIEVPGVDAVLPPIETAPVGFRTALRALTECYRKAEAEGNTELSERAQNAVAALLGHQKFLRDDEGGQVGGPARSRVTLIGIPGGGR